MYLKKYGTLISKNIFVVDILKVTDENSRIQFRIQIRIRIH